ncbi:MAG: AsmA-like C-terminal region-containing protein [Verrucomicrobiae bacterium]|nr:AsmA-like C-terminal region-containing protein [Verrucomicrobiae bacterium]
MAREAKSRFWRKCRIYFRRLRIAVLLAMLALLGLLVYLNQVGLPDFLKRPVLEELRGRGVDLEFSRLRLRWHRGIVAESVRFGRAEEPRLPRLSAREVEIDLNPQALARLKLQVDAISLRGGALHAPVADANSPTRTVRVEQIEARLRFLPGDEWSLDDFRARFAGAEFFLSASVTNASAIRHWDFWHRPRVAREVSVPDQLRRLADTLETISFTTPPELRLVVRGDALDLPGFTARLVLKAADADTPWGQTTNVLFTARLLPDADRALSQAQLSLVAASARTPWAEATGVDLGVELKSSAGQTNLVDGRLTLHAATATTEWASSTNLHLTAGWVHSLTNPIPLSGQLELQAGNAFTRWAEAANVRLAAQMSSTPDTPAADTALVWWTNLQPYQIAWNMALTDFNSEKLVADSISVAGRWASPGLTVTNLQAELHGGTLEADAALDVLTREVRFSLVSDFDAKRIAPVLTPGAQRWLARYSWVEAPHVRGSGALILPAWTNREPDWRAELQPSLRLAGEFAVTNGAYLGVAADWARAHFSYTNMTWHLPDLAAAGPGGQLHLEHRADDRTKDFYFRIHSTMDPHVVRPLLDEQQQRGLDFVTFTEPPVIDAEIWGRWRAYELIGARGQVALTNFAIRGQHADAVVAQVHYTNLVLEFLEPRLWRGTQAMSAAGIRADFNTHRIHFTNGFSTAEPLAVARAIGPKVGRTMEPYRFTHPPVARVSGYAPLKGSTDADLRFDVDGGEFTWWLFRLPNIAGAVHWQGETLALRNIQAGFYWGNATGQADFDFSRDAPGTDFGFAASFTNVNLPLLMADLLVRTNHLEGWLNGQLVITNANSSISNSWQGHGHVRLRDGLIWEIPIFGVLSRPLDSLIPGLGNSRFTDGSARFSITNSVVFSDDLEMRAPAMRLQYQGTVGFDGQVNARVEAELFRDTWLIGRVVSLALWPVTKLIEYKVTGPLNNPKSEPLYMPARLLFLPLHPFQMLEDIFTSEPPKTNAPPVFKPVP